MARVQTPRYVRGNIHVNLLANAYAAFVGASPAPGSIGPTPQAASGR
jgi:hypothetical protein